MKYWAYVNNEILGPYEKDEIKALPAYAPNLLICPQTPVGEKTEEWREVSSCPEFSESAVVDSPIISEQIPDQIQTSSLQIDHNFSMSNSGRMTSARIGQPQPLEQVGASPMTGIDIPINKLEKSGRVNNTDVPWNFAENNQQNAAEQNTEPQANLTAAEIHTESLQEPVEDPQAEINAAQTESNGLQIDQAPPAQQDSFSDIYGLGNTQATETSAEQSETQVLGEAKEEKIEEPIAASTDTPAEETAAADMPASEEQGAIIEPIANMTDIPSAEANQIPELGMQNTQEFTLGEPKTPAPAPAEEMPAEQAKEEITQTAENQSDFSLTQTDNIPAGTTSINHQEIVGLEKKIDEISQNAINREDFTMAIDPIKMKLDQLDDLITSIRDNQMQKDLIAKLSNLENALAELKGNMGQGLPNQFQSVSLTPANNGGAYQAAASLSPADPASAVPQKEKGNKKKDADEIQISGAKSGKASMIADFFGKIMKMLVTLVLLIAIALGTLVALKKFDVFNVSPMLKDAILTISPAHKGVIVPFLLSEQDWAEPKQENNEPQANAEAAEAPAANLENMAEEVPADEAEALLTPEQTKEILGKIMAYKKAVNGPAFEEKIKAVQGYKEEGWVIKPQAEQEGSYSALLSILEPVAKAYSFTYNENDNSLSGADADSEAIIASLVPAEVPSAKTASKKKHGKKSRAKKGIKAAKKANATAAAKPASSGAAKQQDGEYVVPLDEE